MSGLYYRRNRFYNPETGAFTQEDPIGMAGGINVYGFANGDPVGFSDPYGLTAQANPCLLIPKFCDSVIGGVGGAVMGAAVQATSNYFNDRPLMDGVGRAALTGGVTGAMLGGVGSVIKGLRGVGVADEAAGAAAAAGRLMIRPNSSVLAVVDDGGRVIAHSADETLSHAELIRRQLGTLPEGARAVTIVKSSKGQIGVMNSQRIHGNQGAAPAWVVDAVLKVFQ